MIALHSHLSSPWKFENLFRFRCSHVGSMQFGCHNSLAMVIKCCRVFCVLETLYGLVALESSYEMFSRIQGD